MCYLPFFNVDLPSDKRRTGRGGARARGQPDASNRRQRQVPSRSSGVGWSATWVLRRNLNTGQWPRRSARSG